MTSDRAEEVVGGVGWCPDEETCPVVSSLTVVSEGGKNAGKQENIVCDDAELSVVSTDG